MASGIRGLDKKRFPGFGKDMRDAQERAARIYEQEGLGYETLTVHDRDAAQAVRGLLVGEGVACAADGEGRCGGVGSRRSIVRTP